jgi:hypothetical protein
MFVRLFLFCTYYTIWNSLKGKHDNDTSYASYLTHWLQGFVESMTTQVSLSYWLQNVMESLITQFNLLASLITQFYVSHWLHKLLESLITQFYFSLSLHNYHDAILFLFLITQLFLSHWLHNFTSVTDYTVLIESHKFNWDNNSQF